VSATAVFPTSSIGLRTAAERSAAHRQVQRR
jgi:hypothetical protein